MQNEIFIVLVCRWNFLILQIRSGRSDGVSRLIMFASRRCSRIKRLSNQRIIVGLIFSLAAHIWRHSAQLDGCLLLWHRKVQIPSLTFYLTVDDSSLSPGLLPHPICCELLFHATNLSDCGPTLIISIMEPSGYDLMPIPSRAWSKRTK